MQRVPWEVPLLAGIKLVHVPYKGIPEALTETMAGRVQFFISPYASAIETAVTDFKALFAPTAAE